MGSLSSPTLARAHCLWPPCSHTCCLEAEQCIPKTKPQMVKALTQGGSSASASEEDNFPAITAVNALEWLDAGSHTGSSSHRSGDNFSDIGWMDLPMGEWRQEDVSVPNYSSDLSDHLEAHRENDTPKLKTVHIDLLPSYTSTSQSSKAMLTWVPSSCSLPPCDYRHSTKSPQLTVKELIFQPFADMDAPVNNKKRLNQDKSGRTVQKRTPVKLTQKGKGCLKPKVDTNLSDHGLSGLQVQKITAPPQAHCLAHVGQALTAEPKVKDNQQPPRSALTRTNQ